MIYLEQEDIYIPATYQGAPKICFHCRIAGHERKDCPELASLQCYKCKGFGHLRRHCRIAVAVTSDQKTPSNFEEELAEYESLETASDESNMDVEKEIVPETPARNDKECDEARPSTTEEPMSTKPVDSAAETVTDTSTEESGSEIPTQ